MEAKLEADAAASSTSVLSNMPINLPHRPKKTAYDESDQIQAEAQDSIGEDDKGKVEEADGNQEVEVEEATAEFSGKTISALVKKKPKKKSRGKKGKVRYYQTNQ